MDMIDREIEVEDDAAIIYQKSNIAILLLISNYCISVTTEVYNLYY